LRRYHSLKYPTVRHVSANLKRAGTLQATPIKEPAPQTMYPDAQSPSPTLADEDIEDNNTHAEDNYFQPPTSQQGQYPTSPLGMPSPWNTPGSQNDWRTQLRGHVSPNYAQGTGVDDIALAISALDVNQQQYGGKSIRPYIHSSVC
jgi:hypothetical protein